MYNNESTAMCKPLWRLCCGLGAAFQSVCVGNLVKIGGIMNVEKTNEILICPAMARLSSDWQ